MTEQEWLECGNFPSMLMHLRGKVSDRKMRLFAVLLVAASVGVSVLVMHRREETERAKVETAMKDVSALADLVEGYKLDNGDYPKSLTDLTRRQPCGKGPVVEEHALIDPWGRPYRYDPVSIRSDRNRADVWSLGPGGRRWIYN